jgi:hypothetical protein
MPNFVVFFVSMPQANANELAPGARREFAFDVIASYEARGLAYMAVVDESPITRPGLQRVMDRRFNGCRTSVGAFAITFARFGFAEQFTDISKDTGHLCGHFRSANSKEAIEAIGTNLMWGYKHKLALRRFLSTTNSASDSRAPTNSVTILGHLLENRRVSQANHNYAGRSLFTSALASLLAEDIIEGFVPSFQILNPTYTGERAFEKLHPMTQHAFKTLELAKSLFPDQKWTVKKLCDLAMATLPAGERANQAYTQFHGVFHPMASSNRPNSFAGVLEKTDVHRGQYKVVDVYVEPVTDLVECRTKLMTGEPGFLHQARDDAYDIYRNTGMAQELITRGNAVST